MQAPRSRTSDAYASANASAYASANADAYASASAGAIAEATARAAGVPVAGAVAGAVADADSDPDAEARDLMLHVSRDGRIAYASACAAAILGRDADHWVGMAVGDLVAEPAEPEALRSARAAGTPWEGPIALRDAQGDVVPCLVAIAPNTDSDDGGPSGTLWHVRPTAANDTAAHARPRRALTLRAGLAIVALLLAVSLASTAWWMFDELDRTVERHAEQSARYARAVDLALQAELHFKKQVQEWKNVLLRGHVEADRERYWSSFLAEEATTAAHLAELTDLMRLLAIDPSLAEIVRERHEGLGRAYRTALTAYDTRLPAPHRTVDAAVRGVDRAPAEALDELAREIRRIAAERDRAVLAAGMADARRTSFTGGAAAVSLLALGLLLLALQGIRRIDDLKRSVAALSRGDYTAPIDLGRGDKFGEIAQGLKTLQVTLAVETRRLAEQAILGHKLELALEHSDSPTLLLDEKHRIAFANHALLSMFDDDADALRREMPDFTTETLVGRRIDALVPDGNAQRAWLDTLRAPGQQHPRIGELRFRTRAFPIFDDDGVRLGTMMSWQDVTLAERISDEVQAIVQAAKHGDLAGRIGSTRGDGYLQRLAQDINELVAVAEGAVEGAVRVLGAMADGDLTEEIAGDYDGAFGRLKEHANATVTRLTGTIADFRSDADSIAQTAAEINGGNDDLSTRTEQQGRAIALVLEGMAELTTTIQRNSGRASEASELTVAARDKAEHGCDVVTKAVLAMDEIRESSTTIAGIVGMIDEIAFQTNLLALNAAVEAARAGEQGRGFAVVAAEVRTLAQRSAGAAREIKELIDGSVDRVETGSQLVADSGNVLSEIMASVCEVADIVDGISVAGREQLEGVRGVSGSLSELESLTQRNASLVVQLAQASQHMTGRAAGMNEALGFFRLTPDASSQAAAHPPTMAVLSG